MPEDEIDNFVKERRAKLSRIDEILKDLGIDKEEIRKDQIKKKVRYRTEKVISKMESGLNEVRRKIRDRESNKLKQESYNNENQNESESEDRDMLELEKAIEHYNISRTIINNLMNKKLKDHSQYYWIRKGIEPSLITRLTHKRDGMNTKTIIEALKKMKE
jgi:hypothetical protein